MIVRAVVARTAIARGGLASALALLLACAPTPEPASAPVREAAPAPAPPEGPRPALEPHTANRDVRGFDDQPDYESLARALRARVDPRLPAEPPPDTKKHRRAACRAMLTAAGELHAAIARDDEARAQVGEQLAATRDADLAACVEETSVRAATCVKTLLGDRDSEFAWLLDQCSRAYPAAG